MVVIVLYLFVAQALAVKKITFIHESSAAIVLGALFGLIIYYAKGKIIPFSESNFFYFILPPIVLAAGYTLRRRKFIKNLPFILILGVLGTLISMTVFSLLIVFVNSWDFSSLPHSQTLSTVECLLLAAVLCATDTVAALTIVKANDFPELNSILFGEGVVNDAVSILLFETVQNVFGNKAKDTMTFTGKDLGISALHFLYLSVASILLGIAFGLMSAVITKQITTFKEHPAREIIMIFVLAYLSYMVAEIIQLSGIIALFCCGFTMNHYTYYNLSEASQSGSVLAIQTIAHGAEAFLFTYLGFSLFSLSSDSYSFEFALMLLLITLLARFFSVLLPMLILCLFRHKLSFKNYVFIWYGGLIRGAIAYALTFRIDKSMSQHVSLIRQNTLMIVLISTILFGSFLSFFARVLGIKVDH